MSDDTSNDSVPVPVGPWGPRDSSTLGPSAPAARHDGWTGPLMAQFCEVLAETGIVVDACLAVGKSANTAYANRRRDPLFAAMWAEALGIARGRLADALLARAIEGSVEHYYRDGELVGEKRHIDNRLGLAVLRRLDRQFETGSALPAYARQPAVLLRRQEPSSSLAGPLPAQGNKGPLDWDQMIGALRTRDPDAVATALAALKCTETHETHDPPNRPAAEGDCDIEEGTNHVWREHEDWWTSFPPPDRFDGVEHGQWGSYGYKRTCTSEEQALMDAVTTLDQAEQRAAEEAGRTAYFAEVAAELAEAAAEREEEEEVERPL